MAKSPKRIRQVADVIRHQLAYILKKHASDPRLNNVSITSVDVSSDLSNAKVYFIVSDPAEVADVNRAFEKGTGFMRKALAESIDMRYVPKLSFIYDKTLERGSKISELIDQAVIKDQRNKSDNE